MLKYNDNTINDCYNDGSELKKIYYHNAVCYYKLSSTPPTPSLPTGYTEVEYIEADEGQYTILNHYATDQTRFVVQLQPNVEYTGNCPRMFGYGNWDRDGYLINMECGIGETYSLKYGYNDGNWISTEIEVDSDEHIFDFNKGVLYIDGDLAYTCPTTSFTSDTRTGVFCSPLSDIEVERIETLYGKIFSFDVYDNDVLSIRLIPCTRNNDSVAGFYDVINNTFYTSLWAKDFTAGPSV